MTFSRFLDQFHSEPPQKMQGYDAAMFEDMTAEERGKAKAMLLERGLAGDSVDLDGLRHVADDSVVRALVEGGVKTRRQGANADVMRLELLWLITSNEDYLRQILDWIDQSQDKQEAEFAANVLARQNLPSALAQPIVRMLADGNHEDLVIPLLKAWFATQGVPMADMADFQRRIADFRLIANAIPTDRPGLLRHLLQSI